MNTKECPVCEAYQNERVARYCEIHQFCDCSPKDRVLTKEDNRYLCENCDREFDYDGPSYEENEDNSYINL